MSPVFSALALSIFSLFPLASALAAAPDDTFPVIIVFQKDTPFHQFAANAKADERVANDAPAWAYLDRGVMGAMQRLEGLHRFKAKHAYSHAAKGFAASLTQAQITALKSEPTVAYIENDIVMTANASPKSPPTTTLTPQSLPWGINKVEADLSSTRAGNGNGAITNVRAYVIDTGIAAHQDLNLVKHVNFIDTKNTDCNGHGTHVAGTIGAKDNTVDVVGVAPGIELIGVKVLDCRGSGTTSSALKGVDWVTANALRPAVANLSLGGGVSDTLDAAVVRSAASGIFYAIAAGNNGADACSSSPARAGFNSGGLSNGIATTAATDSNNLEASWSNYGPCVDIWSPGVGIVSTKMGGGLTTMSGTSMASPHTAGAGALVLSLNPNATPGQVEDSLRSYALGTGKSSKDTREIKLLQVNSF
jgi:subtilisin family serine protease